MRRVVRTVRLLARDHRVPRWLRGLAAFGLAPVPGPLDEIALLLVAAIAWIGYRSRVRAAWRYAADRSDTSGPVSSGS